MKKRISLDIGGIPNRGNSSYPSGKIWPCREFSVGWVRTRPDSRLDDRPVEYCAPGGEGSAASPAPLDLRNLPNSHTESQCLISAGSTGTKGVNRPDKYGKKGITGYGRKMVKSVGALIDRHYPQHRVTFATVTMPSLPKHLRRELAKVWPQLVNRLMQLLRRKLDKAGMPPVILSVTEVQPKRLSDTGEGYLHLHLLWLNRPAKKGGWSVDVREVRAWVQKFLVERGIWVDGSFVNVDVRSVSGSKANYLAKYVSKGSDVIAEFAEDLGWDCVPGQWWNVTKSARDWVKTHTLGGRTAGELLDALINQSFDSNMLAHFHYLYHIDIEVKGRRLNVGWRGGLTEDCYLDCVGWYLELDDLW